MGAATVLLYNLGVGLALAAGGREDWTLFVPNGRQEANATTYSWAPLS